MGVRIETLGYPSRLHAAHALKQDGLTNAEIAEKLGVDRKTIGTYLHGALPRDITGVLDATAAGRVEHRPTGDGAVREVILRLPERRYARLVSAAIKARATPGAHALALLERGWSAAPGGEAPAGDDAALAEAEGEIERLRSRLAVRDARVAELEGELARVGEDAAVSVDPKTAAEAARLAARVAELEEEAKAAARKATQAAFAIKERDDRIALLEEAQSRACGGAAALQAKVWELKDSVRELENRVAEWRGKSEAHAERADQWQADAQRLEAELRAAERRHETQASPEQAVRQSLRKLPVTRWVAPADYAPNPAALTAGQLRLAQGLRAAGNTPAEIAEQIGAPVALVRKALS